MVKNKKQGILSMITVRHAVKEYIEDVLLKWSPGYASWLKRLYYFCDFLDDIAVDMPVCDLTSQHGEDYLKELVKRTQQYVDHPNKNALDRPLSADYVHGCLRAVKSFSTWLYEKKYIDTNVMREFKLPKLSDLQPYPLSPEEFEKIVQAARISNEKVRNYAIIVVLFDCGLRLSELRTLKLSKIRWGQGVMSVLGKGRKWRDIPFGDVAKRVLIDYIEKGRPEPVGEEDRDVVFLSYDGHAMTNNGLEQMIKRVGKRSGVRRLHPHLIRHTFAINFLANGGDALTLQRILGHESLAMTNRYVKMDWTVIKEMHRKFSPADNLPILQPSRGRPKGVTNRPRA